MARVRVIRLIGGGLLLLAGLVWALQGGGVLGGNAMSGHSQWLLIGAVVAALGLALVASGLRRRTPS